MWHKIEKMPITRRRRKKSGGVFISENDPFLNAIKIGNTEIVKKFITEGADVNKIYKIYTPLTLAARAGHLDIVKLLVENGADVNGKDKYGGNSLHNVILAGRQDIMQYLIDNGADVNAKDRFGGSLLFNASISGKLDRMQFLIKNGADVNAKLKNGYTILFEAVFRNLPDVVEVLLKNGADPNLGKEYGKPLDQALIHNYRKIIELLVKYGAKTKDKKLFQVLEPANLRKLSFEPLVKSLKNPFGKVLIINDVDDLPEIIPRNITSLIILPIDLNKLPELPDSLQYLKCSNNPIKELPEELPFRLKVLICENCKLTNLPRLPNTLEYLNIRNNSIYDIRSLPPKLFIAPMKQLNDPANYEASSVLLLSGNPLPHGFLNGFGSITQFNRDHIHKTYTFNNEMVYTTIFPKGTVLFRDSTKPYEGEELKGIKVSGFQYKIYPEFNVFFYPYPFVAESVLDTGYVHVFELTRDVEVVMGVLPSSNNRSNRYDKNYMMSCNEIPTNIKGIDGHDYDPCLNSEFTKMHKNINGMFMLAKVDTDIHISNKSSQRFWTKYRTNHMDYRHAVGVPEIILHPLVNRYDNDSASNYKHVKELNHNLDSYDEAWEYVEEKLGPNGGWSIDFFTKMYVNYESASDEIKARCVPIEEPYKLHYLNSSVWDPTVLSGGFGGRRSKIRCRTIRKRKTSHRRL